MKVLVGVKRVIDYAVKVRVAADRKGVELANVKMSINPFCEIAVEEAVKLKEKKLCEEIIVVSVGNKLCQETIRSALAMGCDRGIHVQTDLRTDQELQPLAVAKILKAIAEKEQVGMLIVGKQSIDDDLCQTGQMAAALLDWPQCTFASGINIHDKIATIDRETDTGTEKLQVPLPAVITADLRLNTPRYAKLPDIMKAKKKTIEVIEHTDMKIDLSPRNVTLSVEEPAKRKAGIFVNSVDELIDKLKNEAAVI